VSFSSSRLSQSSTDFTSDVPTAQNSTMTSSPVKKTESLKSPKRSPKKSVCGLKKDIFNKTFSFVTLSEFTDPSSDLGLVQGQKIGV
jgi:hypothetical protein